MILRKPYKILIKHFKLIHLILTLLMVYIVYRFSRVINFFDVAISSYTSVLSTNPTLVLFDIYIYLAIFLVILLSIVIIFLLFMKKKSIKLYIGAIIIYVLSFILIAYSYNVIGNMEIKIVDVKFLRNVRDFLMISSLLQAILIILYGIRSFGFDIKKFNFKDDLKELNLVETDNEEFEFNVEVDVNRVHRGVNKGKRFFKYFYVENRYLFFFISSICICILCLVIYLSMGVYNKKYQQSEFFTTRDFSISINNSYITNLDYKGNQISSNKAFVILELAIKTNGRTTKQLNIARPELIVGYNKYYHDNSYVSKFIDIGTVYNNEEIDNNFVKYLLVYPIDKNDANKEMTFRYVDSGNITSTEAKTINVGLSVRNLDVLKETKEYKLGETIDFSKSVLGDTKLTINNQNIAESFKLNYDFCITKNDCYPSIEYLKPNIVNNYDKVLLRLNGEIGWGENTAKSKLTNLASFTELYGTVKYKLNNVEKNDITTLKDVKSIRLKENNVYYLEIMKEIENANEVSIVFKVRDYIYIYKLL